MGDYSLFIDEQLGDDVLQRALREGTTWEDFTRPAVDKARVIRSIARGLDNQPVVEIEDGVFTSMRQNVEQARRLLDTAASLELQMGDGSNPLTTAGNLDSSMENILRSMRQLRPNIVDPPASAADDTAQARMARQDAESAAKEARADAAEVQRILDKVKTLAGEVGTQELTAAYSTEASKQRGLAVAWLSAAVIAVGAFGYLGWRLFMDLPVDASTPWQVVLKDFAVRAVVLAAIGYVISVCVKSYRASSHLAVAYEQRRLALETFLVWQAADTAGDGVLLELVRFVFSGVESGYLDHSPEKTIVEQVSSIIPSSIRPNP